MNVIHIPSRELCRSQAKPYAFLPLQTLLPPPTPPPHPKKISICLVARRNPHEEENQCKIIMNKQNFRGKSQFEYPIYIASYVFLIKSHIETQFPYPQNQNNVHLLTSFSNFPSLIIMAFAAEVFSQILLLLQRRRFLGGEILTTCKIHLSFPVLEQQLKYPRQCIPQGRPLQGF